MTLHNHEDKVVFETSNSDLVTTCSLVLTAVDISHSVSSERDFFQILVDEEDESDARYQLESYISENKNWPPPKDFSEHNNSSIQPPTLLVIGALILFYGVTGPWTIHSSWFQNGMGSSSAILNNGEYYRLVTALTLHADITHLLGNCFLGGFLLHFFCRTTGPGIGVFAVLLSATLGNYINVELHGDNHNFVGFSTAVFAIIGMLATISYHANRRQLGYHLFVPFMAGAGLLAMTGSSGERTDLGAHLFGLISGFFFGRILVSRFIQTRKSSFSLQVFLFLLTVVIVYTCWEMAMAKVY